MKMKLLKFAVLGLALGMGACDHDSVYDSENSKGTKDLKVPQDFSWDMSKDVTLTLSAPVETNVLVFADEKCQKILANLPVSPSPVSFPLSVEGNAEKVYIQYMNTEGKKTVMPVDLTPTRASEHGAVGKLPEDTGKYEEIVGESVINFPSNGWGSLLFEDMWPQRGDYDFNDIAVAYKIQLEDFSENNKKFQTILVGVRLNALGGDLPYQLCLQIDDLHSKDIAGLSLQSGEKVYTWENPGESEPALISFNWKDKKGSKGGLYYNTEKEYAVAPEELEMVYFTIELSKSIKADPDNISSSGINHQSFNFFIRKDDGTEIHLRGYKPTKAFQQRYQAIVQENDNLSRSTYYCTTDNFVWGMKVNQQIDHAVEKVDITKAYTTFADWVQNAGKESTDWFSASKIRSNCIRVN